MSQAQKGPLYFQKGLTVAAILASLFLFFQNCAPAKVSTTETEQSSVQPDSADLGSSAPNPTPTPAGAPTTTPTPVAMGKLTPSTTLLDFGNQNIVQQSTRMITLTNTGNASLIISSIQLTGDNFSTATTTCYGSLAAGASCVISVNYFPLSFGESSGLLEITSNGSPSKLLIQLKGMAALPN